MSEQPAWGIKIAPLFIIPQRVITVVMGFLGIVTAYSMRICLSPAITRLVLVPHRNVTGQNYQCPKEPDHPHAGAEEGRDWSQDLQGYILSSFYIGYVITHIPGGMIADKYGAKWVLGLCVLSTAILTILTPVTIDEGGPYALIALRIIMGLCQGILFPALSTLLADWVPISERSLFGALILGGGNAGSIIGNGVTGLILDNYAWPSIFYSLGITGVVHFIIWTFLCYNNPSRHPFIKPKEKEYLLAEITTKKVRKDLPPTPWIDICLSLPMISLILAAIGHDWAFFVMVTDLPKYMNDVMGFSIKNNGLYSAAPFVGMWIASLISGIISDFIITKEIFSITMLRKINTVIAAIGPSTLMIIASHAGCDKLLVVILFTLCMTSMGTYYSGCRLTTVDLSPNYSGTLMALTNGIGGLTGVFAPTSVGWMTPNASMGEWRLVFWVAFFVLNLLTIPFCIWGTGKVQPWNEGSTRKKKEKE